MTSNDLFLALSELAGRACLAPDLKAVVFVELTGDDPDHWQGRIDEGKLNLERGRPQEPDLTISASSDTAVKIYEKKLKPMAAFMTGKLKIKGDVAKIALLKQLVFNRR